MWKNKTLLLDAETIRRVVRRIGHECLERNRGLEDAVFIGIETRGEPLAERLARQVEAIEGVKVAVYALDVTAFRDDEKAAPAQSSLPPIDVNGKLVLLVDDVLYTGRTVRSALNAIMAMGRPRAIQLAVLVDRGHRELPIRADYVGKNVPTAEREDVAVELLEIDGNDRVWLREKTE
ncbi:MAG: bifunctional pyr operon transcriptional regulator/uracil phosphoribosyltransferase PyrR [Negativicoccus massiliensis]|uniref:bifunctional pyr operon transcriptional regulator/uracil phosphoribosyltransferase PyrR n=1 Tax=Negativicoccus succinicivorans TaxID=620903 RepID=UPI0026EA509F|nr:bifunctional pyr operon transcriptional regulator/uracil phosphoribosyltransferase PyrR [Negativicoccus succinicivorans]MBS5887371.1 bifunctional pyr operon transcriptional regulator/uracil phosphoribosyltransferase PyrR [Negativicoccus succinicivorans]MDU3215443.1 bifunctional pyr operon transcriptional regulator/uracil phosphoribosyltransferase PyrR [Negativicoccus succinicivorans]MDU4641569.1 bifunctional pyr operon transcriptional regulator/uracil phosphoribosyltransferase PyrR [Negativic